MKKPQEIHPLLYDARGYTCWKGPTFNLLCRSKLMLPKALNNYTKRSVYEGQKCDKIYS